MSNDSIMLVNAVLALVMISYVHCTVSYGSSAQYCPLPGEVEFYATETTSSSPITYDWISNYLNADQESAPLYVTKQAGQNFKFTTINSAGQVQAQKQCTGTQTYLYHKLIKEFLFLRSGTNYFVCKFMNSGNPVVVRLIYTVANVVQFVPWTVMVTYATTTNLLTTTIWVWRVEAASVRRITYVWPDSPSATLSGSQNGFFYTVSGLTNPVGSGSYLYDSVNRKFVRAFNPGTGLAWQDVPAGLLQFPANPKVQSFPLSRTYVILTMTASDGLTGSAYLFSATVVSTVVSLISTQTASTIAPSTIELRYFTDNIYNFVRLASNLMVWVTVRNTFNNFHISQIDLTDNSRLAQIQHIGFSKNRAFILYNDGSMDIYIHTGNGQVQSALSTRYPMTIDLSFSSPKQYFIAFDCLCGQIRQAICYSQTIKCIILQKAATGSSCRAAIQPIPSW